MERLLQSFETPFRDGDGNVYDVLLYGRSRPGDTWQGWLTFVRQSDRQTFSTEVETTQSSAEGILYWATGLTGAYFDGAFARAQRPVRTAAPVERQPAPLRDVTADDTTYLQRLTNLEHEILQAFRRHTTNQLATQALFDELPHAHADIVRAIEDLEKQRHLVARRTEGGNDWLILEPR